MRKLFSLLFFTPILFTANAQDLKPSRLCSQGKMDLQSAAKTTVANPAEEDYDMKYVKLNLSVGNQNTSISGDVTTRAKVVVASMPAYVFELTTQLTIDSVLFNGVNITVTSAGAVRTVTLASPLTLNADFEAQVFYHGQPIGMSSGIRNQTSPSWGNRVTYTYSEPYRSRDWWPTKQSLKDKIDSTDTWITVPDSLKAGSNGVLQNITPMPNNKLRFEWHERFPIDYYLISFAVAAYVDYSYYVHFPASSDSMLVQSYIYNNPATLPNFQDQIDSTGEMLKYLSVRFGRYPFWTEKYGHCMAPISGGMEHQTMTTLGFFNATLTVHELGHQWFGDNVTCGSWADLWLNEGFASYTEYLYKEHFWSPQQAAAHLCDLDTSIRDEIDGSVYVDDTIDQGRLFDSRLTYDKGAAVCHALRFVFNNNNMYFQMLRDYQQQFKGSTALTSDLRVLAEQASGLTLDTFFNQWVYGEGYPIYTAKWNQNGNSVVIKLDQTTSMPSSIALFHTPIELKLTSATGDTTIRVYNHTASDTFYVSWKKTMTGMVIDPDFDLVNDNLGVSKDTVLQNLGTGDMNQLSGISIFPNPANDAWTVSHLEGSNFLTLTDMNGRLIWKAEASNEISIPAQQLAPGIYFLRIKNNDYSVSYKLVKQ